MPTRQHSGGGGAQSTWDGVLETEKEPEFLWTSLDSWTYVSNHLLQPHTDKSPSSTEFPHPRPHLRGKLCPIQLQS